MTLIGLKKFAFTYLLIAVLFIASSSCQKKTGFEQLNETQLSEIKELIKQERVESQEDLNSKQETVSTFRFVFDSLQKIKYDQYDQFNRNIPRYDLTVPVYNDSIAVFGIVTEETSFDNILKAFMIVKRGSELKKKEVIILEIIFPGYLIIKGYQVY